MRLRVQRNSRNTVTIARDCTLQDDVSIVLKDGTLTVGEGSRIRRNSVLKVDGDLHIGHHTVIGYGNVLHCAESISFGDWSGCAEYVTITDSTHHHDGEDAHFRSNVTSDPVVVGKNVWFGSKATVLPGVRVGHNAVVAAHALVIKDVPEGTIVGGVPAKVIADRALSEQARRLVAEG